MKLHNLRPEEVLSRLKEGTAKVAVIGLGYIGLPLAVYLSSKGIRVVGVEKDTRALSKISKGEATFYEPDLSENLEQSIASQRLTTTPSIAEACKQCDVLMVTVGTPVDSIGAPRLTDLVDVLKEIARSLLPGKIVILRSTVPPHTTRNLVVKLLQEGSGLQAGLDFALAFCPERTIEGNAFSELGNIPHVVGGIDHNSTELAAAIFSIFGGEVVKVADPAVAEMAKLFDNVYRDVNIALANELALICEAVGVDVIETIRTCNTSPRTNVLIPGAGVGGSCLNKDPLVLLHLARDAAPTDIIRTARSRNQSMPTHVIELISSAFNEMHKEIAGSKILILGLAFKGSTDDLRETPAKIVVEKLRTLNCHVVAFDPYVPRSKSEATFSGITIATDLQTAFKDCDCVVVMTDHPEFRKLDLFELRNLLNEKAAIVDGRHVFAPENVIRAGLVYRGVGRIAHPPINRTFNQESGGPKQL